MEGTQFGFEEELVSSPEQGVTVESQSFTEEVPFIGESQVPLTSTKQEEEGFKMFDVEDPSSDSYMKRLRLVRDAALARTGNAAEANLAMYNAYDQQVNRYHRAQQYDLAASEGYTDQSIASWVETGDASKLAKAAPSELVERVVYNPETGRNHTMLAPKFSSNVKEWKDLGFAEGEADVVTVGDVSYDVKIGADGKKVMTPLIQSQKLLKEAAKKGEEDLAKQEQANQHYYAISEASSSFRKYISAEEAENDPYAYRDANGNYFKWKNPSEIPMDVVNALVVESTADGDTMISLSSDALELSSSEQEMFNDYLQMLGIRDAQALSTAPMKVETDADAKAALAVVYKGGRATQKDLIEGVRMLYDKSEYSTLPSEERPKYFDRSAARAVYEKDWEKQGSSEQEGKALPRMDVKRRQLLEDLQQADGVVGQTAIVMSYLENDPALLKSVMGSLPPGVMAELNSRGFGLGSGLGLDNTGGTVVTTREQVVELPVGAQFTLNGKQYIRTEKGAKPL